jgi:hypothetical protein
MDPNHISQKNMRDRILEKIEAQEVLMRPKFYFTLKIAALVLVMLAVLVISIFIFNFILFSVRVNSHDALLGFGPRGIEAFIIFFPWVWFLLDVVLIAVLEWLIREFRFGYKIPVLYLLAAIFFSTAIVGLAIDRGTDVNDRLLRRADRHELPLGRLYEGARRPMPGSGVCLCAISAIKGDTLTVYDPRVGSSTLLTVVLPPNDPRATTTLLKVGDLVFIAGDVTGDDIHAFGLKKVSPNTMYVRMGQPPQPLK